MSSIPGTQAPMTRSIGEQEVVDSNLTTTQMFAFAVACGLTVANIFYAQPLIGLIGPSLGMPLGQVGLIVTLTQVGYGAGLLFLVPLSDVVENRRLIVNALVVVALGLLGVAWSYSATAFLLSSFVVGVFAAATQILVPFASHLAPPQTRGRVVGNVMSGLLGGVMLARPFSSYVAATFGWRAVFFCSAGLMLLLAIFLREVLPQRRPRVALSYGRILRSLPRLAVNTPILQRRAFYQAMMFAAFNIFWTGAPLLLAHDFAMGQRGIALFTLAGAAGALSAPIAGRLADRGKTRLATGLALLCALIALLIASAAVVAHSLALLVLAALLLDAAVQVCQVLSMRTIYTLAPESRGRFNGLFIAAAFVGGATGSGLAPAVYTSQGWSTLACVGVVFVIAALTLFVFELRTRERQIA